MASRPLVLDHILNFMKICKAVTCKTKYLGQYGQDKEQITFKNVLCMGICRKPEWPVLEPRCVLYALRVDMTILADEVTFWITSLLKVVSAINEIDTNQFKAHSSRAVAMSAFARYLLVQDIARRAGWSN